MPAAKQAFHSHACKSLRRPTGSSAGHWAEQRCLRACCSEARERAWTESLVFRAGASERLLTFPVILHFLLTVVAPINMLSDQIVSYEALGEVLRFVFG